MTIIHEPLLYCTISNSSEKLLVLCVAQMLVHNPPNQKSECVMKYLDFT